MSHHSVKRLGILGDDENASSIYVVSLLMCAPTNSKCKDSCCSLSTGENKFFFQFFFLMCVCVVKPMSTS